MLLCLGSRLLYLRFLKLISLSTINKRRYIKVYSFDRMKSRREKSLDMLKKPTSRSCWLVHAFWYFGIFFWKWKWNENYLKIKSVVKKVSCIYFNIFWQTKFKEKEKLQQVKDKFLRELMVSIWCSIRNNCMFHKDTMYLNFKLPLVCSSWAEFYCKFL